jgi:hypothetical protein
MKESVIKTVYIAFITVLFAIACVIGGMCIRYNRIPEAMVIIGSSLVVFLVSMFLLFTQKSADKKLEEAKLMAEAGDFLMKSNGWITQLTDATTFEPRLACGNGSIVFHKNGFFIYVNEQYGQKINYRDYLSYDDITDVYEDNFVYDGEEQIYLCIKVDGKTIRLTIDSQLKLMATEDILNKQTNYRFDEGEEKEDDS